MSLLIVIIEEVNSMVQQLKLRNVIWVLSYLIGAHCKRRYINV